MNKIIIAIVVILLIAAGGYFIFIRGNKTPTPESNQLSNQQNQQSSTTESKITIKNFVFDPSTLTIKKGTTVIWTNEDSIPHKIKSDTFNSEIINKGESFQFKFNNKGTYDYICGIHQYMKGEIIVED